jgi:hypothetical protein
MAEVLKREYDIVVLKVELLDKRPNVRFTLQAKIEGDLTNIQSWQSDTSDMGFLPQGPQRSSYDSVTGNLRGEMIAFVDDWIHTETTGTRPIWVHLVKPYGVLRFVPWERALGTPLSLPVLMLPDFIFPPPRESSSTLDVALCGSAPLYHETHYVHSAMRDIAHRILDGSARRTRLHIFSDADLAPSLSNQFKLEGRLDVDVFVYSPAHAAPYVSSDPSSRIVDQTGQLRSPWLLWMRDALRGQSIDVVHFVCHGYLARDRGALLFAQTPLERTDRFLAGPVGPWELQTFLTQIGAWSSAFTSVQDNNSEPGLRALADDIAQTRPGPLLMHNVRYDPACAAVGDAYRFLYSIEPMDSPASVSLFMYCQPYRVKTNAIDFNAARMRSLTAHPGVRNALQEQTAQLLAGESSPLDQIFTTNDNVLPWVASTERFAEQVQLRFQQVDRDRADEGHDTAPDLQRQVTLATLDKLRASVAKMASGSGGSGGNQGTPGAGETV